MLNCPAITRREFAGLCGAAIIAWPLAARAQKAMPVIGFLRSTMPDDSVPLVTAFRLGLSETGYVEGRNVAIEYRWAEGHYERLSPLASDLVGHNVDVIVASGGDRSALAAKRATSAIPIVAIIGGDPVAAGLAASLARPSGNLTGVSFLTAELMPKQLELLSDLLPQVQTIGALVNPNNTQTDDVVGDLRNAAQAKGVRLQILSASSESAIEAGFVSLKELQAGGLVVQADPFFTSRREQIVALASHHAVPTIYEWRGFTAAGGLVSYGASIEEAYRQLGIYVGRILKGEKPADLPIQQPTKFELVINLKAAKALGLNLPPSILARADEIIE
jgi:putative ABC transport system substrate-binding protein